MLEKLLTIKSVRKMLSQFSYEYWLEVLEEDFNDTSEDFVMLHRNRTEDRYIKYMTQQGYKGNNYMKFIKIFYDNHDRMISFFREKGNNAAISFINTVPYAFKEMLKICARVIDFPDSKECTVVRNMTSGSQHFINYDDATLFMSIATEEDIDEEDAKMFWKMFEELLEHLPTEEICQDVLMNKTDNTADEMVEFVQVLCINCPDLCNGTNLDEMLELRQARATPLMDSIYTIGLWISVFFLAVTILVFFLVPYLRRSIHGKCTIFHLLSMVVAYSSLCMAQYIHMSAGIYCLFNGFALQFSFLAMFFWLNVMCFDILLAFSFLKKKSQRKKKNDNFKMIMYSLYGWGVPCIILAVSLAMEYGPWLPIASSARPGIGDPKCFFKHLRARWLYLYGPIAVLIVLNLIMFTITAIMIFIHHKKTKILNSKDSQSNQSDNARLLIYINLFILMGANWLGEVLAWNWPNLWIFYVTDITTALQGLIVFILFICKKRILTSLNKTLSKQFSRSSKTEQTSELKSSQDRGSRKQNTLPT